MGSEDLSKLKIADTERESAATGGRSRWVWWMTVCLALFVGLAVLVWSGALSSPLEVQSVKASRMSVARALTMLNASGYVVAQRKAAVSSKATGRLARLYVEEGTVVKKGDTIASLENEDLRAILQESQAALRAAGENLKNAEAELHEATLNYNRHKPLKDKGAISDQAFDATEARYRKAVAMHSSARFAVERASASAKVAEVNLEYSFIHAPFDGVILTKNADEGEVVAPFGGAVNAKAAVATMADMDSLLVEVDVSESNLEKVAIGAAAEIRLDALPSDSFPGGVHMIVPTADRSKATVLTKVKFLKLDKRVLPEMSAKVAFLSRALKPDELEPFLGIPASAIRESAGEKVVFRIKGNEAVRTPVKIGRHWGEMVEILAGLREGEPVVLDGGEKVRDRSRIKVKE